MHPGPPPWPKEYWPYDGPYGRWHTASAATMIEKMVRYLNNATRSADALPHPPAGADLLTTLRTGVFGFDQLLEQTGRFYERLASDNPTLYDYRDEPKHSGSDTARELVATLTEARRAAAVLAAQLDRASGLAACLGVRDYEAES